MAAGLVYPEFTGIPVLPRLPVYIRVQPLRTLDCSVTASTGVRGAFGPRNITPVSTVNCTGLADSPQFLMTRVLLRHLSIPKGSWICVGTRIRSFIDPHLRALPAS